MCEWGLRNNTGWTKTIKDDLSWIGLVYIYLNEGRREPTNMEVFIREKDIFHQTSFYEIQNDSSKLKTCSKLKRTMGVEYYLGNIHKIKDRISMTKFKLSNHKIIIEKGRHNNINSFNRFLLSVFPKLRWRRITFFDNMSGIFRY